MGLQWVWGGMETGGAGRKRGRKKGLALSLALLWDVETGGVGRKWGMKQGLTVGLALLRGEVKKENWVLADLAELALLL